MKDMKMTLNDAILQTDKETLIIILRKIIDEFPEIKWQLIQIYKEALAENKNIGNR